MMTCPGSFRWKEKDKIKKHKSKRQKAKSTKNTKAKGKKQKQKEKSKKHPTARVSHWGRGPKREQKPTEGGTAPSETSAIPVSI